jgi:hypothetical protein
MTLVNMKQITIDPMLLIKKLEQQNRKDSGQFFKVEMPYCSIDNQMTFH